MPGSPNVLDLVHRSCTDVAAAHAEHVKIDDAAVSALAAELLQEREDVRAAVRGLPLPIKFSSLEQELTLLALYHLLDFGSGYDPLLTKTSGGRDARETLLFGLIGLHLGGTRMDHHKLKSFTMYDLYTTFNIEATQEVAVMPGVTMTKPGPLQPHAKALLTAINESGAALEEAGAKSPGELLLSLAEGLKKAGRTTAGAFVEELIDSLPGFRDSVLYDGRTLTLHRRAQNLAADLAIVYGGRDDRFAFSDVDQLAADSGATTIAVLRAKGVLQLSEELASTIDEGSELPAGPHERALRAAAVAACDRVVAAAAAQAAGSAEAAGPAAAAAGEEGEESGAAAGAGAAAAGAAAEAGKEGAGTGAGSTGPAPFRAVDVGAFLAFLTEEGRPLHGKITRHVTRDVTGY
ncbi:hypothetical protein HYH03_006783 [Edaphochlamys debaryana]|uniref:Queuosine 5'-phosphate N-glycosylase/hydrolase n=1 Tax=Edaphochlamys debaryana TaxID=47281 RepID=A0A836C0S2_9CHLO|nr:hypothetical protein HYH03_006783 [Edaphochlamys debaryana]|eukprot:KAG2495177.1 hypothetical protein HYH03_006783 [Edaphochlamys debaryana]